MMLAKVQHGVTLALSFNWILATIFSNSPSCTKLVSEITYFSPSLVSDQTVSVYIWRWLSTDLVRTLQLRIEHRRCFRIAHLRRLRTRTISLPGIVISRLLRQAGLPIIPMSHFKFLTQFQYLTIFWTIQHNVCSMSHSFCFTLLTWNRWSPRCDLL